jgi:hypothetical protein
VNASRQSAQRYHCPCDHTFQVFGGGRHRRFYELDDLGWVDPLMTKLPLLPASAAHHAWPSIAGDQMAGSTPIEDLRAEARYHRERYDIYRAKMYGLRATNMTRLRELERAHQGAEARLRGAQQERA